MFKNIYTAFKEHGDKSLAFDFLLTIGFLFMIASVSFNLGLNPGKEKWVDIFSFIYVIGGILIFAIGRTFNLLNINVLRNSVNIGMKIIEELAKKWEEAVRKLNDK